MSQALKREIADDIDTRLEKERSELGIDESSGVHERMPPADLKVLQEWKQLAEQFGATFILKEARTRWEEIIKGSIINVIMQKLQVVDVHIVSDR